MVPEENVSLARYTSLHVGGPARYFARVKSDADSIEAVRFAREKALPFFILGKGSNTLFSDSGYAGIIIHMEDRTITVDQLMVTASAGVFMRQLVNAAIEHELAGLEELAGIPGTVGGAVRGNAGTWQTEIKDVVTSVDVLDTNPAEPVLVTWTSEECGFKYRDSIFKHRSGVVVLRARFSLRKGEAATSQAAVARDLQQRHERQPYNAPSAGSVFKNPDKAHGIYSGALIEQAGLKGHTIGGASISEKHANFIVNNGSATSTDIHALITLVQDTVWQTARIKLEPEIEIVE